MRLSLNFLSYFDMFSVPFTQSIRPRDNSLLYRSVLGGFVSLIICTLGMMYATNIFFQWFENQLIMKISSQPEGFNSSIFNDAFENRNYKTEFLINLTNTDVDPFDEQNVYLIPLLINISDPKLPENILYFHNSDNKSLELVIDDRLDLHQYILTFASCIGNERYLTNNQKCASQEQLSAFLSTPGLELDFYVTQHTLDVYSGKVGSVQTYFSMYLQKTMIPEYTVILQYSYYELRTGQFFDQKTTTYMVSTNFLFFPTYCEPGFLDVGIGQWTRDPKLNPHNIVAQMYLGTDSFVDHVIAEYPSISEMFASIGSTFQAMMLVKYFILYFNRSLMKTELKNYCRDLYYPELKKITSFKNGKDHLIYHELKKLDPKKYSQFLSDLDKRLDCKMNFSNLIYEISRMQAILQDLVQYSQLKRSALNFKLDQNTQMYEIVNLSSNNSKRIIMDSEIDPFIYSYPIFNQVQRSITTKIETRLDSIFQREKKFLNDNEEIQQDRKSPVYSESQRPQLSF